MYTLSLRDGLPFEQSSIVECGEAMDYLAERRGIERFILGGLCSGADAAYFTAVEDSRVVGIFQLDGFAYRTWRYYVTHYAPRLLQAAVWRRFFKGQLQRFNRSPQPVTDKAADVVDALLEKHAGPRLPPNLGCLLLGLGESLRQLRCQLGARFARLFGRGGCCLRLVIGGFVIFELSLHTVAQT